MTVALANTGQSICQSHVKNHVTKFFKLLGKVFVNFQISRKLVHKNMKVLS